MPDVGFPFICCEYVSLPLVNKEAASAYGKAEYSQAGNPNRERERERKRERVGAVRETTCSWRKTLEHTGRQQPHGDTHINRNGFI